MKGLIICIPVAAWVIFSYWGVASKCKSDYHKKYKKYFDKYPTAKELEMNLSTLNDGFKEAVVAASDFRKARITPNVHGLAEIINSPGISLALSILNYLSLTALCYIVARYHHQLDILYILSIAIYFTALAVFNYDSIKADRTYSIITASKLASIFSPVPITKADQITDYTEKQINSLIHSFSQLNQQYAKETKDYYAALSAELTEIISGVNEFKEASCASLNEFKDNALQSHEQSLKALLADAGNTISEKIDNSMHPLLDSLNSTSGLVNKINDQNEKLISAKVAMQETLRQHMIAGVEYTNCLTKTDGVLAKFNDEAWRISHEENVIHDLVDVVSKYINEMDQFRNNLLSVTQQNHTALASIATEQVEIKENLYAVFKLYEDLLKKM